MPTNTKEDFSNLIDELARIEQQQADLNTRKTVILSALEDIAISAKEITATLKRYKVKGSRTSNYQKDIRYQEYFEFLYIKPGRGKGTKMYSRAAFEGLLPLLEQAYKAAIAAKAELDAKQAAEFQKNMLTTLQSMTDDERKELIRSIQS